MLRMQPCPGMYEHSDPPFLPRGTHAPHTTNHQVEIFVDVTGTDSEVVPPPTELYVGENELYCCPTRRNPIECTTVVHAGLKVRKTYGIQQYGIG